MRNLLNFVDENSRVRNIISNISEMKGHQGTVVRFSDEFLMLFNLWKNDPNNFRNLIRYYFEFSDYNTPQSEFLFPQMEMLYRLSASYPLDSYTKFIDFNEWHKFQYDLEKQFRRMLFHNSFWPLELVICIYNDADISAFEKIVRNYRQNEQKGNVPEFKIIIERRERNVFFGGSRSHHPKIIGGISIGNDSNRFGTLGGILTNDSGKSFGLTCAHVTGIYAENVFQPASVDSRKFRKIGNVDFTSNIRWTEQDSICNSRHRGNSDSSNNIDAALISINPEIISEKKVHNLGKIGGEKSFDDIHQNMNVEFNGRSTGFRKKLVVGGVCVSYKIAYEGENENRLACFTNLIELRNPYPILRLGNMNFQKPPVKHGDSGAWICSNDSNGYNWCGMLISGDIDRGYFLTAEDIQNCLRENDYNLNCSHVHIEN